MSRKDYIRISATICMSQISDKARRTIALDMCNALKGTNQRYDSARFYRACIPVKTKRVKG